MSIQDELKELIENVVLEDIDDYIDELLEQIASKKDTPETKEELANIQDMKKEFKELLIDLENGEIDDEEAKEIIDEINDMIKDDFEE